MERTLGLTMLCLPIVNDDWKLYVKELLDSPPLFGEQSRIPFFWNHICFFLEKNSMPKCCLSTYLKDVVKEIRIVAEVVVEKRRYASLTKNTHHLITCY